MNHCKGPEDHLFLSRNTDEWSCEREPESINRRLLRFLFTDIILCVHAGLCISVSTTKLSCYVTYKAPDLCNQIMGKVFYPYIDHNKPKSVVVTVCSLLNPSLIANALGFNKSYGPPKMAGKHF